MLDVGDTPRMLGGAMIGLQLTPIKGQFAPLLNGLVINDELRARTDDKFDGVEPRPRTSS